MKNSSRNDRAIGERNRVHKEKKANLNLLSKWLLLLLLRAGRRAVAAPAPRQLVGVVDDELEGVVRRHLVLDDRGLGRDEGQENQERYP